jgi:Tfp pilus assembly protein PilN
MKLVNLLPKIKQKELIYEEAYHSMVVFIEIGIATLLLVFAAQFGSRFYIGQVERRYDKDIQELKQVTDKQENAELKKQIQDINAVVGDYNQLAVGTPQWSKVMQAFAHDVPEGVSVQTFLADGAKLKIDISGVSPTREKIIELHRNISSDTDHFEKIDYPLENIARPTDTPFHFTFYLKPQVLNP